MVRAEGPVARGRTTTGRARTWPDLRWLQRKVPLLKAGPPRQLIPTEACAAHRKSANATGSTISLFSSSIMVGSVAGPQRSLSAVTVNIWLMRVRLDNPGAPLEASRRACWVGRSVPARTSRLHQTSFMSVEYLHTTSRRTASPSRMAKVWGKVDAVKASVGFLFNRSREQRPGRLIPNTKGAVDRLPLRAFFIGSRAPHPSASAWATEQNHRPPSSSCPSKRVQPVADTTQEEAPGNAGALRFKYQQRISTWWRSYPSQSDS